MTEITVKVPNNLLSIAQKLVADGWFLDENEIFLLAFRNYLRTHSDEIITSFIKEDIEWGLNGKE
ncbi:MAG: hypothetical protein KBF99_15855 [Leptospiraceae bacterium]|jgi:hypothetical protein|nr:CopG family transcriptional regulator [Leptospiraceae bacterium]MBK7058363.1 CopG family transcriptional regulator [Leptospiraceae bacterium]MBK9503159.1 CopG family transcriptional regulator [Leptospiraceae bacterium]MBL0263635.1 CopG family transcriptional regulator [Leptospiraceae bacterium]MBP9164654.1 hypothetical protein [Leptospiraceae bacterium]